MSGKNSKKEQVETYDLREKPFTKALLLRASEIQDKTEQELKTVHPILKVAMAQLLERFEPTSREKTLHEFAANCALLIAFNITIEAMKNIGRMAPFLPHKTVPNDAPIVVAFSLFVITGVYFSLKSENVELEHQMLIAHTASSFFKMHSDEKRATYAMAGIETFKTLVKSSHDDYKKWRHDLMELKNMYIYQWTLEDIEPREYDFIPQFGSMLSTLLKTAEWGTG